MQETDIPVAFPNDAIMASHQEIEWLIQWAKSTFAGEPLATGTHSSLLKQPEFPFSFKYNGEQSGAFLPQWNHSCNCSDADDRMLLNAEWSDSGTGLVVSASVMVFKEIPAIDWVLHFENRGSSDTPIIEDIQTVDIALQTDNPQNLPILHQLHGDSCGAKSFAPFDIEFQWPGQSVTMIPSGGRPSNSTAFPFFDFEYDGQGIITAIGWSGQWAASYRRSDDRLETTFRAGMEHTHLLLHPGEKIRTPRVMMMTWSKDRAAAHNRFRRLMLFKYLPRVNGRPVNLPVCLQTFDLYHNFCTEHVDFPEWATEAGQIEAVEAGHKMGCDTYWFDAGWFEGDFPAGAGNWYCKSREFPNGLRPVSDRCHELDMKFVLWFEPCRVAPGTQIATEHPQWLLGEREDSDRLFNLGIPEARQWLTDLLANRIAEFGVDIYREDYNIDPLDFWRSSDLPDRQGMTEIRFVEGHYAMWDELRARYPQLWIDNCASGGRRIDLETCMRAVPLWRSDTGCFTGHPEWNQLQTAALSQYLPLHTACGWDHDAYTLRSSATAGVICQFPYHSEDFSYEAARKAIAEADENRKYWYGDFYNLTGVTYTVDDIIAYQFHRPDLDAGLVYAFRRQLCTCPGMILSLQGLDMSANYKVVIVDNDRNVISEDILNGASLYNDGLLIKLPRRSSVLVKYSKV